MNTKTRIAAAFAAAAVVLSAGAAAAQNWQAQATYGHIQLAAGFTPDPYNVNLTAGGEINAQAQLIEKLEARLNSVERGPKGIV